GHSAFFGAYVMITLAMITFAGPALTTRNVDSPRKMGYWAFWMMVSGMFGMTLAFGAAGISQTYLERIMGLGYMETQLKIQVHFIMLTVTGILFTLGVGLFVIDFFSVRPRILPPSIGADPETLEPELVRA
ncbi:MAG: cbb3-type cytochrome c oxidase subunit I, partial [Gemmatimonadaceae bacterium]